MTTEKINEKLAIVIPSCDKYSDLWDILCTQIETNFKDIELTKYIICNSNPTNRIHDIEYINIGNDLGWSTNLKTALNLIEEQFILLWIDDLILTSPVDTKLFNAIVSTFITENGNYLRLSNVPTSNENYNEFYGIADINSLYRTSTVMSIWKKKVLYDLLIPGENAWDFEKKGTIRSNIYDNFFVTYDSIFNYSNAVIKGKWNSKVKKKLMTELGYSISDLRPTMTMSDQIKYDLRVIASMIYYRLYNQYIYLFNKKEL